jgi:uncharacterized surface protein with fasciclin (FAS1) repeats
MKLSLFAAPLAAAMLLTGAGSAAAMPAGEAKAATASNSIVDIAIASADHSTLVAALSAAGLVETLASPGPFTVFAPTNAAFAKLPAGTVDSLLKPENRQELTAVLTYHVVPGKLSAADIAAQAKANGGKAVLTTVQGETLTVWNKAGDWYVTDAAGKSAKIGPADLMPSNGVIHVIDSVLLPN